MHITPVPCLSDNYAYLVHAPDSQDAVVVDPSQADPVIRALEGAGLRLAAILSTHHHFDHTGGNGALVSRYGRVKVYGHASEKQAIVGHTDSLEHGDEFEVAGLHLRALHVPGHTLGSMAYVAEDAVFTGDTLFVAGCGRLFEGTAKQMHDSLNRKLGTLPEVTRVFCGHEYTAKNLAFAQQVEPGNEAVLTKLVRVAEQRRRREPTVPSTIGEELQTNPFLRTDSEEIRANLGERLGDSPTPEQVLAAVRAAKDRF